MEAGFRSSSAKWFTRVRLWNLWTTSMSLSGRFATPPRLNRSAISDVLPRGVNCSSLLMSLAVHVRVGRFLEALLLWHSSSLR